MAETSTSAADVAKVILNSMGTMSTWKLQKLCYYVDGWHLARTGTPAFFESVKAWADGPVVPQLYHQHKLSKYVSAAEIEGDPESVDAETRNTIGLVVASYGAFDGVALRAASHADGPWREARGDLKPSDKESPLIPHEQMRNYFKAEVDAINTMPEPGDEESISDFFKRNAQAV